MPLPGPHNDLTDVAGLMVGSHTDRTAVSDCTVVLCPPEGAVAGVIRPHRLARPGGGMGGAQVAPGLSAGHTWPRLSWPGPFAR